MFKMWVMNNQIAGYGLIGLGGISTAVLLQDQFSEKRDTDMLKISLWAALSVLGIAFGITMVSKK
jgi:hypothetical protein